jgi:IS5 family transposase
VPRWTTPARRSRSSITTSATASKRTQGIFSVPTTVELCFLAALLAARRHGDAGRIERMKLQFGLVTSARKLDAWALSCPQNFEAHALIVRGELARVRGRQADATDFYERAIAAARRHGSPKREALALELAARHARTSGDAARGDSLEQEATEAYRRWGAATKASRMGVGR